MFCISIKHKKNPKSTFWRRSPSDLRNLGARVRPNPRWARFPQNSNSKFGRGSAQILNLNFAAPAGPDRTTFPRPGRKIFAARGGEHFVAGVRKSCGPGYLIAKGCAFSELCIILYIFSFFNTKLYFSYFLIKKLNFSAQIYFFMNFCPWRATKLRSL